MKSFVLSFLLNLFLISKITETKIKRDSYPLNEEPLNPDWVSGFIEGDGSFFVSTESANNRIRPGISIGLNVRDLALLKKIKEFFSACLIQYLKS